MQPINVLTYNIHKGMSPLNRHVRIQEMMNALKSVAPDIVILQEVQGKNVRRLITHEAWPVVPQHKFLGHHLDLKAVYGLNAVYDHGHHGNAVLSRFPIKGWSNKDISVNALESRGILQCTLQPKGWLSPVAIFSVHLNLLARDRRKQYQVLIRHIQEQVPEGMPVIVAGDFNDWRGEASDPLLQGLGLQEVFLLGQGRHALSFPARMPLLSLDRIYIRGLHPVSAMVMKNSPWSHLSDHLPLLASLVPLAS